MAEGDFSWNKLKRKVLPYLNSIDAVPQVNPMKVSSNQTKLFSVHRQIIWVAEDGKRWGDGPRPRLNPQIDWLYINEPFLFPQELPIIEGQHLILGMKLSEGARTEWQRVAEESGIPCHDLRSEGALVVSLDD